MAQRMPLPLTVSCFSKIQIGFSFLVPAQSSSPGQRTIKRVCVCVCVYVSVRVSYSNIMLSYNKYKATTSSSERWRQPVGAPSASHWHDYIVVARWRRQYDHVHVIFGTEFLEHMPHPSASLPMPPLVHLSPCQWVSIPGGEVVGVGFCRGWHSDVKIVEQRCHNSDTSARCQDGDWWPCWQHDDDVVITGMLTFSARQCHWHDDDHVNQGMTNYRRRPQRSITQDHRGSAIMG